MKKKLLIIIIILFTIYIIYTICYIRGLTWFYPQDNSQVENRTDTAEIMQTTE